MAADGEDVELEELLRDIGQRLESPPDDADSLLKLLDEVEDTLLRVEQSPPESTANAIVPAKEALIKKELLGHSDAAVKLAVASCISEITRITAPETPYEDDVMKDVFSIIVGAFENLDDTESPYFRKTVAILETVAKVRSCVVMLDLECDDLIGEMFRHFFKTVSSSHPANVISSMSTIMKLVIEEGEEVQTPIAECLLQHAKCELKETSAASYDLAEKVIGMCAEKLKPVFVQLLEGTPLKEYSHIISSVCEGSSDVREDANIDPKDTVDDGKLSERTISDELPQESSKLEQDVSRPELDVTQTTAISSGATPVDNGESNQGPPSPKEDLEKPEKTKFVDQLQSGNNEGAESVGAKAKESFDLDSDENLKLKPSSKSESSDIDKEALAASGELSAETKDGLQSTKAVNGAADSTPRPTGSTPLVVKPKRGRPPGPKSLEKKSARKNRVSGLDSKKVEQTTESAGKLTKRSSKDDAKSSSRKASEESSSKKQNKISLKQQKDETLSEEDLSLKEMVSPKSLSKCSGKTKGQSQENIGSKRKRSQEDEETPRSRKNKGLDDSLIGARIKVWWPDDKKFYKGVVDSFDTGSKRHKIAYEDGDVEVLLLRDEKWEFIGKEQDKTPDVASEKPRGRKGGGNSAQPLKEANAEVPESDESDLPKKRGRPKGVRSNGTPNNVNSATPSKSKGKTTSKDAKETPKVGSDLKKEGGKGSKDKATQSVDKTKHDLPDDASNKSASKSKEVGGGGKDSKDENKSAGKVKPGRKPKNTGTPVAGEGSSANLSSNKEKRKDKEDGKAAEVEQEGSGAGASTGKKRRRKV